MVNRKTGHVTLIDFGFASSYLNPDGSHITDDAMKQTFQGSIAYATFDQMNFFQTSRKDDIITAFYILVQQLNNNNPIGSPKDLDKLTEHEYDVEI